MLILPIGQKIQSDIHQSINQFSGKNIKVHMEASWFPWAEINQQPDWYLWCWEVGHHYDG